MMKSLVRVTYAMLIVLICSSCPSKAKFSVVVTNETGRTIADSGHFLYQLTVCQEYVVSVVPPIATMTTSPGNLSNETTIMVRYDVPGVYYVYITDYNDILDRITLLVN